MTETMPMRKATREGRGIWFARVDGEPGLLPNVWNHWVKGYLYDDEWMKYKEDNRSQKAAYFKAIKQGRVCLSFGRPINSARPLVFTPLGFDSVWKITADVIDYEYVRFRFIKKDYDLYPRAPGHNLPTTHPATRD